MIDPGAVSEWSAILGGGGIGVVWGWWAVRPLRRARRPVRSMLALAVLATLSGAALWLLGAWPAVIAFAAGGAAAGWAHAAWLHQLHTSFIPKEPR
jgi:hypothetical protein